MGERKHSRSSKGWVIGFFILLALLAVTMTTNYQKSDKIKYLISQLSAAQSSSQLSSSSSTNSGSSTPTQAPVVTTPVPTVTTSKSWLCDDSLYTGFSSINLDLLCPSSSGGTNELTCTGSISTELTSSTYQYAPLNMTCTIQ